RSSEACREKLLAMARAISSFSSGLSKLAHQSPSGNSRVSATTSLSCQLSGITLSASKRGEGVLVQPTSKAAVMAERATHLPNRKPFDVIVISLRGQCLDRIKSCRLARRQIAEYQP